MKRRLHIVAAAVALLMVAAMTGNAVAAGSGSVSLADLVNPDDVMLRKPSKAEAQPVASKQDDDKKRQQMESERKAAEEKARAEAERKAAEEKARLEAERKAAEEKVRLEAERKAAEEKARLEAERKVAEEKARLEAERKAAEEKARLEAERKAAEEKARLAEEKAKAERDAAEKAEAERKAAEEKAKAEEAERKAAEERARLAEEKARKAQKTIDYLKNPDPDEKAPPKKLVPKTADGNDDAPEKGKAAEEKSATPEKAKSEKKQLKGRDAIITAERTDYDRKEGVVLFDRNVYVDDEQYQLHADRLFLFLDGTNDLKRLVAIGHVAITNEEKNASCSRAVYTKSTSKIVMYGADRAPARLYQGGKKGSTVLGERITFWLNSEQVEIERPVVTVPGGSFRGGDAKDLLKGMK